MKRGIAFLLIALGMIGASCFTVSASAAISLKLVPRTKNGTIFYLNINSDELIGAAVFELDFDGEAVEYRSVSGYDGASVQVTEDVDHLRIAYAHPTGGSGDLIRLTFKALTTTETEFTLHTEQAVDDDISALGSSPDYILRADVGRQTTVKSGAVSIRSKTDTNTEDSPTVNSISTKSTVDQTIMPTEEAILTINGESGDQVLTNREGERWFVIGACAAVMAIIAVKAAFILRKRRAERKRPPENLPEENEDNSDLE